MLTSSSAERFARLSRVARSSSTTTSIRPNPFSAAPKETPVRQKKTTTKETRYEKHVRLSGKRYDASNAVPRSQSVSRRARYVGLPAPYPSGKTRGAALVSQMNRRAQALQTEHPSTGWTTTAALLVERRPVLCKLPTELELREMEALERWDPTSLSYGDDPRKLWKEQFERKLKADVDLPDWVWEVGSFFTSGRVGLTKPTRDEMEFVFPDMKRQRLAAEALKAAQEEKRKREEDEAARVARGESPSVVGASSDASGDEDDDLFDVEEDVLQTDWEVQAVKSESAAAVKDFEPAERATLADASNNVESLFRKLDEKTYLVVRRKSDKKWEFPRCPELEGVSLQDAAQELLETRFTSSAETMFVSNAPVGHTYDAVGEGDSVTKRANFFFKVNVLDPYEFALDLFSAKNGEYDEFAFATREELLDAYIEDEDDKDYFDGLLMPSAFPVENRRLPKDLRGWTDNWEATFGETAADRAATLAERR